MRRQEGGFPVCDFPDCGCIEELQCSDTQKESSKVRKSEDCLPIAIDPDEQEIFVPLLFMFLQESTQEEIQGQLDEREIDFVNKMRKLFLEITDNLEMELDETGYILLGIRDRVSLETLTALATSSREGILVYIANYLLFDRELEDVLDKRTIPIE